MVDRGTTDGGRPAGSSRRPRAGGLKACAVVGVALWLLMGAQAAVADPPVLAGTTSIGGDRTGYAEVVLPRDLHPLDSDKPAVALEGGGSFLGIALRPTSHARWVVPPTFELLRVSPTNDGTIFTQVENGADPNHATLPAGSYRLYLIAAAPARVTLTFSTLGGGQVSLAPDVATPFQAGPLAVRRSEETVLSFGESHAVTSDGIVFERALVQAPPPGATLELCQYPGGDQTQGASAYDPGCPGTTLEYKQAMTSPGEGAYKLAFPTFAESFGTGGNVSTLPAQTRGPVETFGMWMSFDPPAAGSSQSSSSPSGSPPPTPSGSCASCAAAPVALSTSPMAPSVQRGIATLGSNRLAVHGRYVGVPLVCSAAGACRGTVSIKGAGSARFALAARQRKAVSVRLSATLLRRLRRAKSLRLQATLVSELPQRTWQVKTNVRVAAARSHG